MCVSVMLAVSVHLPADRAQRCHIGVAGLTEEMTAVWAGSELYLSHGGADLVFRESLAGSRDHVRSGQVVVRALMPGLVMAIHVSPQARVEKGETLLVLSAMKMELRVTAPVGGCVLAIGAAAGEQVPNRHVLVEIQSG